MQKRPDSGLVTTIGSHDPYASYLFLFENSYSHKAVCLPYSGPQHCQPPDLLGAPVIAIKGPLRPILFALSPNLRPPLNTVLLPADLLLLFQHHGQYETSP